MREKILTFIEKNSRIDLKELAIMLGVEEAVVMNELEHRVCCDSCSISTFRNCYFSSVRW